VVSSQESVNEEIVFFTQETILFLGVTLGGLALILSAVTVALLLLRQGPPRPIRSRSTRVSVNPRSEP